MNDLKITINGKDYAVKQSFRALMLFEEMTGKNPLSMNENITDVMMLFYCFLRGANKDFMFEFDAFVDVVDSDVGIFESFTGYLQSLKNVKQLAQPKKKGEKR